MANQSRVRGKRGARTGIAALLVAGLILSLGALGAPAAVAAPPITFSLTTVDLSTGAPVTEVASGTNFTYSANVGCPDPSGCGPATLTVQFPVFVEFLADAFSPPTGARVSEVSGDPATGMKLVLAWDNLDGTAVGFLPASIGGAVEASNNGESLVTQANLVAGSDGDIADLEENLSFSLRAYERPGLANETQSWSKTSLSEGSTAEAGQVLSTVSARATANSPSTLTFQVPGPQSLPAATLPAAEAFDLSGLSLSQNPGGAEAVFELADGTTQSVQIAAGTTTVQAPENAVGYTVHVYGILSAGSQNSEAEGTVAVEAAYSLRTERRSGGRIIADNANSRQIRVTAAVTNTVSDSAPGESATVTKNTAANLSVEAVAPEIKHSMSWETESGESTSVYGSDEPSTVVLKAANAGGEGLVELRVTMPHLNSRYFDYQVLTSAPRVVFPAGATGATVTYSYGKDSTKGETQSFVPGAPGAWIEVPGPEADAPAPEEGVPALQQVSGIEVVFFAADGSIISGHCELAEQCAAQLELSSKLRKTLLSTGAQILPPAGANGETTVGAIAEVAAKTTTGATITQTTTQATLRIVRPQITVKLGKRFGEEDGSDQTVYPLTGLAHAGDLYDPEKTVQDFVDHKLRLVASTTAKEGASEDFGATELRISDPEQVPTIANVENGPFNSVQVTALSSDPAVCTTGADDNTVPVESNTVQSVWVVDRAVDPRTVVKVPFDASVDVELIVGLELLITPLDSSGAFPADVRCVSGAGSTVKFRDTQLVGGAEVTPATIGSPDTPGLLSVANVAKLGTGTNGDTATSADSLYLVDLLRAAMYKNYASGASRSGVAGQGPETSFLLSGVPAASDSVRTELIDGAATTAQGLAFDVFELTEARGARMGPDQQLSVAFLDRAGQPVGPKGTVASSTEIENKDGVKRQLSEDEIADSQSDGYLAFQRTEREIEWDREWTAGEKGRVWSVVTAVTREDHAEPLQRFGAFSVTLDVRLRDHFASAPATPVSGTSTGQEYANVATIQSEDVAGQKTELLSSSVSYLVFEASELYGNVDVTWREIDRFKPSNSGEYLIAQYKTPSRVTIDAQNRSALGAPGIDGSAQWSQPGTIGVGMATLGVSVGGAKPDLGAENTACVAERDRNPFAINDFTGLNSFTWPVENAAVVKPGEDAPRVAAKITYSFTAGADEVVDAPVDTPVSDLNPTKARWSELTGISVQWAEGDKYVGVYRSAGKTSAQISFDMVLRDALRPGFNYDFGVGVPQCLLAVTGKDVLIDGAIQANEDTVDQKAWLTPGFTGTFKDLPLIVGDGSTGMPYAEILLDVASSAVDLRMTTTPSQIYRDKTETASWSIAITNSGMLDVTALRLATDSELLAGGTWPDTDPAGYTLAPGSAFDAFDVTGATLTYPTGATSAVVWVRGEDGIWGEAAAGPPSGNSAVTISLPTAAPGPTSWNQVTGFRVQFTGVDEIGKRIKRTSTGTLALKTQLREHLRSNPAERAPATALPESGQWGSAMTAAGVSYISSLDVVRSEVDNASVVARIDPGAPAPLVKKYARYDSAAGTGIPGVVANPGSWVNFTVVLENRTNATSNLYGFSAVDTVPEGFLYNDANPAGAWKVNADAAPGVTASPDFVGPTADSSVMRWTWPADQVLKPGERVVITVPLQVADGLPPATVLTNTARLVGSGIPGTVGASVCAEEDSAHASCTSSAYATTQRNDSVRAESYIDASPSGYTTLDRQGCQESSIIENWAPGAWVRNPCLALTTVDSPLTYRLKLINSGNVELSDIRFVDRFPMNDDEGTVLESKRGSEWTPTLVPGSVRLIADAEAAELGARGDGVLDGAGFRFSTSEKVCNLRPDAFGGPNTLSCENQPSGSATSWSTDDSTQSRALGADIVFPSGAGLKGGEYVVVEFEMTVPKTGETPEIAWNSVAITGRATQQSNWLPASESPRSGARAQDALLDVTMDLADGPATKWHLNTNPAKALLKCLVPGLGQDSPIEKWITFDSFSTVDQTITRQQANLPLGGTCWIADVDYEPEPAAADKQYGSGLDATGFSFATTPLDPIVLGLDDAENAITVTNSFVETQVTLSADATGNAASFLPADAKFLMEMRCTFGDRAESFGPFKIAPGASQVVAGLPVGATCTATETDHLGATVVSATVDDATADITPERSVTLRAIEAQDHSVNFVNTFETGGDLTVVKTVETPKSDTAVGDVEFELTCRLGGNELVLGDRAKLSLTFGTGQTQATGTITSLPADAECTVHESEAGGANVVAPDRTVTILPADEVIVDMVNTFSPAQLSLEKRVTGAGAAGPDVPSSFGIRASCTRELTIGGIAQTVTDHNAVTRVTPGTVESVSQLPEGSRCAVSEPDSAGADSTALESMTAEVRDESDVAGTALVSLRGPDSAGNARATEVRVTNEYAKPVDPIVDPTDNEGLSVTGASPGLLGGAALLLIIGAGVLLVRRRWGAHGSV